VPASTSGTVCSSMGKRTTRAALVNSSARTPSRRAPQPSTNVGETQFQLQDYAGALRTFRRFLGEFGPNESHRAEIERNVEILRTRVGHVSVTTTPSGADITLDDQPVGKTPLAEPLLVSVGHRKLGGLDGRAIAGHVVCRRRGRRRRLGHHATAAVAGRRLGRGNLGAIPLGPKRDATHDPTLRIAGFVATGVLAAGAVTFGVLAVDEARVLRNARNTFPAVGATINHDANLTMTYSILADSLAAGGNHRRRNHAVRYALFHHHERRESRERSSPAWSRSVPARRASR